ncbi:MAG: hypothetical protein IT572_05515 [Deltaproteobacteria bacterium]|nr:hypothetical protein [Deltaproteobacteria bacterium]
MKPKSLIVYPSAIIVFLAGLFFANAAAAATVVEVPAKDLPALVGQPVAAIRLYASPDGGAAKPIPFQIDERDAKGQWLMDSSVNAAATFDPQDVLLFHLDDAGAALQGTPLPAARARMEIAAAGKFVYAAAEENPGPRSTKSYVSYRAGQDRVSTAFYDIGFSTRQALVQDVLILRNGKAQTDVLDRFKVRFNLAIKNFFDFKIEEGDVDARVAGTRVGSIRVIRRVVATKKLGPINVIPKSVTDFLFYPNWVEVPTRIQNPIDGPKFLEDKTRGLSGYDFTSAIYGSVVYASQGGTAALNGVPEAAEQGLGQGAATWWSLTGPAGSLVVGIQNDGKLEQLGIRPTLRVIDDANNGAPPEGESGQSLVGFDLPYHKIPKGSFLIQVRQVFPWRFEHGRETAYLEEAKSVSAESVRAL